MNIFLILLPLLVLFWVINSYNQIIKLGNRCKEAWSGIDVQLKLRYNLVPNLVEIVKSYAGHEKSVFIEVSKIRTDNTDKESNIEEVTSNETALTQSLKSIFALVENYPELKANNSFLELQKNLINIEDQLQYARRYYNGSVRDYNTVIQSFPNNLLANLFNKKERSFFELERSIENDAPVVSLS